MNMVHLNTVDGRNPAPVDMVNVPLFTGFDTSQMVQDFFHQQYLRNFWPPPQGFFSLIGHCPLWDILTWSSFWEQVLMEIPHSSSQSTWRLLTFRGSSFWQAKESIEGKPKEMWDFGRFREKKQEICCFWGVENSCRTMRFFFSSWIHFPSRKNIRELIFWDGKTMKNPWELNPARAEMWRTTWETNGRRQERMILSLLPRHSS